MLDQLRKLGLIVEVEDGVVCLRQNYVAAKANSALSPEQAKALVHFDNPIVVSKILIHSRWNDGEYEEC